MTSKALRIIFVIAWLLTLAKVVDAESLALTLSIRSDEGRSTPRVLRAQQGDRVVIEWSADKPMVVHIHPYEIEQALVPGTPSRSEFTARISGRFPIEAHSAASSKGRVVAYLEVLPR